MNKLLALLGLIALVAVGGLFFFAGFFTGSNVRLSLSEQQRLARNLDKVPMSEIEKTISTESASLSEKVQKILSIATDTPVKANSEERRNNTADDSQVSVNSLLKEIAASHAADDDCSVDKTQASLNVNKNVPETTLEGKRIVFVGYFKTNVALQIQRLLLQKGYQVHVEESRTSNHESFVFCGPFKERKNAENLVTWLNSHNFADARVVKVERDALEETLFDASANNSDIPSNVEQNVPEASETELQQMQQILAQQQALGQQQAMLQQQQMQQAQMYNQEQQMMRQQQAQQQALMQQQQMQQPQMMQQAGM